MGTKKQSTPEPTTPRPKLPPPPPPAPTPKPQQQQQKPPVRGKDKQKRKPYKKFSTVETRGPNAGRAFLRVGRLERKDGEKRGRPLRLDLPLTKKICKIIAEGNYIEVACACCGVARMSYLEWLKQGARDRERNKESIEATFSSKIERAWADSERLDVQAITSARARYWQAAAWKLERKATVRWGRSTREPELGGGAGAGNLEADSALAKAVRELQADGAVPPDAPPGADPSMLPDFSTGLIPTTTTQEQQPQPPVPPQPQPPPTPARRRTQRKQS